MRVSRRFLGFLTLLVVLVSVTVLSMRSMGATLPVARLAAESSARSRPDSPSVAMDVTLFRNIAHRVNPAVVAIMTRSRVATATPQADELFRWFYGVPPEPGSGVQRGLGSGFLISEQGDILTNNHVVANADVIEVALLGEEGTTHRARLIGRDPLSDSALIRLENAPRGLPVATLGDSDAIEPGDWVMAIGNPFQLGHTVTVGVVSYIGRPFEVREGRWQKMIQTDASINPGNSGGPLLNVNGEVVGINAAILGAESGGNIGIGFAVPINSVTRLLPQLRSGTVVHGRIGIQVRSGPVSEDEAKALGLPRREGAIVTAVERGSPADRGGIQAGDVIVSFNGVPVGDADDLVTRVASTAPESEVSVTVQRDGRERLLRIRVERLVLEDERGAEGQESDSSHHGLELGEISPAVWREPRPDTALQHFANDVAAYVALRQRVSAGLPNAAVTSDPTKLEGAVKELADRIRAARRHARPGEIFTDDVGEAFRNRISRVIHERGISPAELVADVNDETSGTAARGIAVNAHFRWNAGSEMPLEILESLPPVPEALEYRFVKRDLVLVDVDADLVVDILRDAIPRH